MNVANLTDDGDRFALIAIETLKRRRIASDRIDAGPVGIKHANGWLR